MKRFQDYLNDRIIKLRKQYTNFEENENWSLMAGRLAQNEMLDDLAEAIESLQKQNVSLNNPEISNDVDGRGACSE